MSTRSYDWIAHHAATRGTKTAMEDLSTARSFSYTEMNDRTSRLAYALVNEFGVGFGDRVGVLAENTTNFFEVQFACWKLGAIFVPLNWRLALPELEYIVGDCGPDVLMFDGAMAEAAHTLATRCSITHLVAWGQTAPDTSTGTGAGPRQSATGAGAGTDTSKAGVGADGRVAPYEDVIAAADPLAPAHNAITTHDTPITIMYTSGTTGRPKGAIITHGMTLWNAVNCVEFFALGTEMVNLAFLPLFHTGGLNVFANPAFHFGGTNLVMRAFDPAEALALLTSEQVGVTHTIGVPANWLFMSQVPEFSTASFPTLVAPAVGGSPTPEALIETWAAKGLPLQQAFGMTETSPLVLSLKPQDAAAKIGSAGVPALHTEVRIVDEDGADTVPGETGELWVRGPNITPGYWNRPDATAESITDGWLHTGDAARIDDDGFYYIVDRWKDMYISGGENVYPAEVENTIYQLPQVGEVAVIGVDDAKWVEVGRAIVVRKPGESLSEADVINHCRQNLARYKVPQSVVFIDEIPHNATGKVLKRELRETYGQPSSTGPAE